MIATKDITLPDGWFVQPHPSGDPEYYRRAWVGPIRVDAFVLPGTLVSAFGVAMIVPDEEARSGRKTLEVGSSFDGHWRPDTTAALAEADRQFRLLVRTLRSLAQQTALPVGQEATP